MKQPLLAAALTCAALLAACPAMACAPLLATDPVTGETWSSGSPEWFRREQAAWRAEADAVLVAQARAGRMVSGREIEFTLVPIATVYGEPLPDTRLTFLWEPGNTCNTFTLGVGDFVVVYLDRDAPGDRIVGVTVAADLQDRPSDFGQRFRQVYRGIIPGPPFEEPMAPPTAVVGADRARQ